MCLLKRKLFKLFIVSMLIGLLVPAIPALAASEVIHQTSFEDGLDGWGPFGPSTVTITNEAAHDGSSSVKVTDRSADWNGLGMNVTDIFQQGGIYQGTGYFKLVNAPKGTRTTKITIAQDKGGSAEYDNLAVVEHNDDEWVKLEFEYAATGDYDMLQLYFEHQDPNASFYVDNITFTMVKAPAGGYIYPEKDEPAPEPEPEPEPAPEPEPEPEPAPEPEPVVVVPEGPSEISRADFLVVLVNTLGLNAEFTSNFDDVKEGTFYYDAVGIARAIGLVEGVGDNKYNPDSNISTQDLMVLTVRALEKFHDLEKTDDTSVLDRFSDKDRISSYAVDSVATLAQEGFLVDIGESLDPRGNADWGLALNLLYQVSNKLAE